MDKVIKIGTKILYQILVIVCLLAAIIIIFQKVSNSNRSIAGYRIFRVITGSMEPEYDIGEVVICKEVEPKSIKVGDDIVYFGTYGEYNGKIIMHSVVAIDTDKDGKLNFHAKGLHSSSVEDPQIKESQIYGVVMFKSGILTILYKMATNIYSLFAIITLLTLNVFISFRVTGKEEVQQLNEFNENYEEEIESEYNEAVQEEYDEEIYEEDINDTEDESNDDID